MAGVEGGEGFGHFGGFVWALLWGRLVSIEGTVVVK